MLIFLLLALAAQSWADPRTPDPRIVEPPLRVEMPPPPSPAPDARNVFQSWMPMPLDHFDPQNTQTFLMRFMFNEQFFGGEGSPIFILIGGEWAIAAGWLQAGNMYEMARENQGYMIYTEHRYYGITLPFAEFTTENLRFLNVDQALADLANFINELKKVPRFAESKIILYGGSYAANMALWFKQRYPHLAVGAVASSGPILGKVDFFEYLEVVHEAFLSEGGEQCIAHIRQGLEDTVAAMNTESGRRTLEQSYRLCQPLDYNNAFDLGYFSGLISWTFSTSVQQARPGTLLDICNNFTTTYYGNTPMEKIGGYIATIRGMAPTSCWSIIYENYVASYATTAPSISRAWYYQTCTEYGFYQTAPRSGTAFDVLKWLSVEFYVDLCKRIFDEKLAFDHNLTMMVDDNVVEDGSTLGLEWELALKDNCRNTRFDEKFVYDAVDRVNTVFGGLHPNVNNTINIHGNIDPWRALGVYDRHLTDSSPTYNVPRASHCFDMQGWRSTDTIRMTNAQQAARRLVAEWLSSG